MNLSKNIPIDVRHDGSISLTSVMLSGWSDKSWAVSYENNDKKFGAQTLDWTDKKTPRPTDAEIEAVRKNLEATLYKIYRLKEYPPITDYIDGVVKGDQVQIQAYIDACLAVKAKYPKGA